MDLISRQDAIDMLAEMQGRCTSKVALIQNSKIWQQIKELPSAQPEPNEKYNSMVKELLELEEQTKHFYLTSTERREFQAYVEERLAI